MVKYSLSCVGKPRMAVSAEALPLVGSSIFVFGDEHIVDEIEFLIYGDPEDQPLRQSIVVHAHLVE
ncbi:hypothetical protein [Achromobacter phage Motura]|uniref:Uncharacterized protein n=1 Tax=Achromobacter phage Motura TaxID=2591403 RepID=A0A514CSS9_9CAUD|nr:hypothetical protein H1O15_gp281 [Achromobacter phage Motura]QDH83525.1 hypothetical protein [Achromobacter phage Motura]